MNPNIPDTCTGCGRLLLLENLYVDDGCPCNTPRGVNFKPKPCATCKTDNCVKPGHRLAAIFGDFVNWVRPVRIPVKAFRDDESLPWEERFNRLMTHHGEETAYLIEKVQELEQEREQALKDHDTLVRQAFKTGLCPHCNVEMDRVSMHERDSSNDRHVCPSCKWAYGEMETWRKG